MTSDTFIGPARRLDHQARALWGVSALLVAIGLIGLVMLPLPWNSELLQAVGERADAGKPPTLDQFIDLSLWWASLAVTMIGIVLTASGRLWTTCALELNHPSLATRPLPRKSAIATWIALLAITVTAGVMRTPRLDHSFWNDEEVTLQDYAWGEYKRQADAEPAAPLRFKPVSWKDAVFYNRGGSNHLLNSILTKATIDVDNAIRGNDGEHFSERTARLIPFAASLATVLLIGWIGWRSFNQITGLVAAATLALNPWHIRYSTEIRGYSVLLLLILVAMVCLFLALRSGKRRYWLGFAAAEAGFMLAFFASVYVAIALNLMALAMVATCARSRDQLIQPVIRLAAFNLIAAALFIALATPSIPQFLDYLKDPLFDGFASGWLNDFYHHLVLGIPPWRGAPELNAGLTAPQLIADAPWIHWVLWVVTPVLLVTGGISAVVAKGRVHWLMVGALTLGPLLSYLHNWLGDSPALPWYLLFAVLPFALLCGYACSVACAFTRDAAAKDPKRTVICAVVGCLWIVAYAAATSAPRHYLAAVPRQPLRDVAEYLRGDAPTYSHPQITDRVTASLGFSVKRLRSYDPHVHTLRTLDDLTSLTRDAHATGLPLFVAVCGEPLLANDANDQACVDFLHDPANGFTKQARIRGFETQFSYDIYVSGDQ